MNVVGGYVVTDRMLQMFRQASPPRPKPAADETRRPSSVNTSRSSKSSSGSPGWPARSAFVLGLVRMNSPATARNGNLLSAGGMVVADRRDRRS